MCYWWFSRYMWLIASLVLTALTFLILMDVFLRNLPQKELLSWSKSFFYRLEYLEKSSKLERLGSYTMLNSVFWLFCRFFYRLSICILIKYLQKSKLVKFIQLKALFYFIFKCFSKILMSEKYKSASII